jgi:hypothetical protein
MRMHRVRQLEIEDQGRGSQFVADLRPDRQTGRQER